MFQDNQGGIVRDPQASPEAQILVDRPRKEVGELSLTDKDGVITISTGKIQIEMDKRTSLFKITDKIRQKVVVESARPVDFMENKSVCHSKHTMMSIFMEVVYRTAVFLTKGKYPYCQYEPVDRWWSGFSYSFLLVYRRIWGYVVHVPSRTV